MALIIALILGAGEGLRAVGRHYQIGIDLQMEQNCLPARLVVIQLGRPKAISRGDVLAYRTDRAEPYLSTRTLMGKRALGVAGDTFRINQLQFSLNGTWIGELGLCRKKYLSRYCDDRTGVVPEGHLLMIADHVNSFDGRYWGPIPQTQMIGRIVWPDFSVPAA